MLPSCTQIGFGSHDTLGCWRAKLSTYFQCVVARLPFNKPAFARRKAPVQTEQTLRVCFAILRSHAKSAGSLGPRAPAPAAMMSVSTSRDDADAGNRGNQEVGGIRHQLALVSPMA